MNPSITRWKIVPGYSASSFVVPSRGSVQVLPPDARLVKFSTVLGACSGMSVTVNEPRFVTNVAVVIVPPLLRLSARGPLGHALRRYREGHNELVQHCDHIGSPAQPPMS